MEKIYKPARMPPLKKRGGGANEKPEDKRLDVVVVWGGGGEKSENEKKVRQRVLGSRGTVCKRVSKAPPTPGQTSSGMHQLLTCQGAGKGPSWYHDGQEAGNAPALVSRGFALRVLGFLQ